MVFGFISCEYFFRRAIDVIVVCAVISIFVHGWSPFSERGRSGLSSALSIGIAIIIIMVTFGATTSITLRIIAVVGGVCTVGKPNVITITQGRMIP